MLNDLSLDGQFYFGCNIISLEDVEWLRREHRIVGRFVQAPSVRSQSTAGQQSSTAQLTPVCRLPLQLVEEEAALLLSSGTAVGVEVARSVLDAEYVKQPTTKMMTSFSEANAKHISEVVSRLFVFINS